MPFCEHDWVTYEPMFEPWVCREVLHWQTAVEGAGKLLFLCVLPESRRGWTVLRYIGDVGILKVGT